MLVNRYLGVEDRARKGCIVHILTGTTTKLGGCDPACIPTFSRPRSRHSNNAMNTALTVFKGRGPFPAAFSTTDYSTSGVGLRGAK
jgi:hypothetical protein